MPNKFQFICKLSLASLIISSLNAESVTALNFGTHEWNSAEWTPITPTSESTIFLNANTFLTVPGGTSSSVKGFRIGNVNSEIATLSVDGGSLDTHFIVCGDAPNGNASFILNSGSFTVVNTSYNDFEIGNPATSSDSNCSSVARLSGGTASLADVRFNLRSKRSTALHIQGSRVSVRADTLSADAKGDLNFQPGKLNFTLDSIGVSSLQLNGAAYLGEANYLDLVVDGTNYSGGPRKITLISATTINGTFRDIQTMGFANGANVYNIDNTQIVLEIL